MIAEILFWITALLILHTYVVYPLLLLISDKLVPVKTKNTDGDIYPAVSVLMAVHNEQDVIVNKLEKLFASDYPADKLEVLVASDASDDNTNELLKKLEVRFPQLRNTFSEKRVGKPALINMLSENAAGEILIITDANVVPGKETLKILIQNFKNSEVSLADTRLVNTGVKNKGISLPESAYVTFESRLKNIEGRLCGKMMGPFGGFYAVRKSSYQPNQGNILADDFRICMNILRKGEKAVSDRNAIVYEDVTDDLSDEFNRKVRISAGNFQNLVFFKSLLINPFSGLTFIYLSHKVLRWLTPFLWFVLMVTNVLLAQGSIFYTILLILQVIFIILPPLDILLKRININVVPLRFFTHLYFMNIALFVGFVRYLQGITTGAWTPTKRNS